MEVSGQLHSPIRFSSWETATGTRCIGGWVSLRAGLYAMEKRTIFFPYWESNADSSVVHPELKSNISERRLIAEMNWFGTSGPNPICLSRLEFTLLLPNSSRSASYKTVRDSDPI
jgi:hypothetical protein